MATVKPVPKKNTSPSFICPVTGFPTTLDEAVFSHGMWVHPDGADERGYLDTEYDLPITPHELAYKKRTRPKPDPKTGV